MYISLFYPILYTVLCLLLSPSLSFGEFETGAFITILKLLYQLERVSSKRA